MKRTVIEGTPYYVARSELAPSARPWVVWKVEANGIHRVVSMPCRTRLRAIQQANAYRQWRELGKAEAP